MYSKLKSNLRNNLVLYYFLLSGFLIRLIFATFPGFKIDVDSWFAWSLRLADVGFLRFYQPGYFADYPPGLLYLLFLLGNLKIYLNLSPETFYIILKIPSILAETAIAYLVYKISLKETSKNWAFAALLAVLYCPGLIFNSSIWGQGDAILTFLLLITIFFLDKKQYVSSSLTAGIAFLTKPQAIALSPLYLLSILKDRSINMFWKLFIPGLIAVFLIPLPFFLSNPLYGLSNLLISTANQYTQTSLFAYNFWGVIGFWIDDSTKVFNLPYQFIAAILFSAYWVFVGYLFFRQKRPNLFLFSSLALLAFFFLPTRIHERYLYPAIPFLFITAAHFKSKLLYCLTILLSSIYLLNLYFVYVYYNEFYLKLPQVFYIPNIYEFFEANGKLLSIISTLLFLLITITISKKVISDK